MAKPQKQAHSYFGDNALHRVLISDTVRPQIARTIQPEGLARFALSTELIAAPSRGGDQQASLAIDGVAKNMRRMLATRLEIVHLMCPYFEIVTDTIPVTGESEPMPGLVAVAQHDVRPGHIDGVLQLLMARANEHLPVDSSLRLLADPLYYSFQ